MKHNVCEAKNRRNHRSLLASARKISIKEGSASSVMDGFGNRYITPYALALGASNFYIGLISSLPGLLGTISQLFSLRLMKNNSRRKIVFSSVLLQAILWLPLITIGFLYFTFGLSSNLAVILLILFYSLMVISGSIAGPVWNSWMKDIITEKSGEYFGKRNRITGFVATSGMLIAGLILNYFGKLSLQGFLIIFTIAFIGRSISAYFFTKQYEPKFRCDERYYFSFIDFSKRMFFNNFGRFVIFISLVSFATAIASPFFAVYMLKNLDFSYIEYTLVTLSSAISTLIFMPVWGKFADKFGNIKVLKINGFLVSLVPLLWLLSIFIRSYNPNLILIYLITIELFSGFTWAGFNLAASDFIYDAVTRQRMPLCVAYFNIINAFGIFIGSLSGGLIASTNISIFGLESILIVFIVSLVLRLSIAFFMTPVLKEVREVEEFSIAEEIKDIKIGESFKGIFVFEKIRFNHHS